MREWTVPLVSRGGRRRKHVVEADSAREAVEAAREESRLRMAFLDPEWADENGLLGKEAP